MQAKNLARPNIGFMQGRLSKIRNNRIQSFPWGVWEDEFSCAFDINLSKIEWTIDSDKFEENPLITQHGKNEIINQISKFNIKIPSVTCDYFMENPPWKTNSIEVKENISSILKGMNSINSQILVIPLVDNSSLFDSNCIKTAKLFFTDLIPSDLLPKSLFNSVISIFTIFVLFKLSNIFIALFNSIPFLTAVPVDGMYLGSIESTSNDTCTGEFPTKFKILFIDPLISLLISSGVKN